MIGSLSILLGFACYWPVILTRDRLMLLYFTSMADNAVCPVAFSSLPFLNNQTLIFTGTVTGCQNKKVRRVTVVVLIQAQEPGGTCEQYSWKIFLRLVINANAVPYLYCTAQYSTKYTVL
jgi:hypothetical protein